MAKQVKIKKELSEEEFERIYEEFQKQIEECKSIEDTIDMIQMIVKKVTPAQEIFLLNASESGKALAAIVNENYKDIDISKDNSMLAKCYRSREALFSNDIARDTDYNEVIDNFSAYPLKNLLLLPIFNNEKEVSGIIWAAIPQKDINQYMQSDVEYMMRLCALLTQIIEKEQKSSKSPKKENLEVKESANEKKETTNKNNTSSIVKKMRSWLFNRI